MLLRQVKAQKQKEKKNRKKKDQNLSFFHEYFEKLKPFWPSTKWKRKRKRLYWKRKRVNFKTVKVEAEAEAASFKKLEAEVDAEVLHAEEVKNSPLQHHCLRTHLQTWHALAVTSGGVSAEKAGRSAAPTWAWNCSRMRCPGNSGSGTLAKRMITS